MCVDVLCGFRLFFFLSFLNLSHKFICRMWIEVIVFIGFLTLLLDFPMFLVLSKLMDKRR